MELRKSKRIYASGTTDDFINVCLNALSKHIVQEKQKPEQPEAL